MANQRVNVYLSDNTLRVLKRLEGEICRERGITTKNNRSAIISEAVMMWQAARLARKSAEAQC